MTIWKYKVFADDSVQRVEIPGGMDSRVVAVRHAVGYGVGVINIWVECDPALPSEQVGFTVYGTGHSIKMYDDKEYVGTAFVLNVPLVWHVYRMSV